MRTIHIGPSIPVNKERGRRRASPFTFFLFCSLAVYGCSISLARTVQSVSFTPVAS